MATIAGPRRGVRSNGMLGGFLMRYFGNTRIHITPA